MLTNSGERLEYAIKRRGHSSVAEFARLVDVSPVTMRQQINRGSISKEKADKFARRLRVPVDWLLYGRGANPFDAEAPVAGKVSGKDHFGINDKPEILPDNGDAKKNPREIAMKEFWLEIGALRNEVARLNRDVTTLQTSQITMQAEIQELRHRLRPPKARGM
jgi:hypothetical protein